jgi:hypothetical protein
MFFLREKYYLPLRLQTTAQWLLLNADSEQRSQHAFYQIDQLLSFKKSVAMIIKKYRQEP